MRLGEARSRGRRRLALRYTDGRPFPVPPLGLRLPTGGADLGRAGQIWRSGPGGAGGNLERGRGLGARPREVNGSRFPRAATPERSLPRAGNWPPQRCVRRRLPESGAWRPRGHGAGESRGWGGSGVGSRVLPGRAAWRGPRAAACLPSRWDSWTAVASSPPASRGRVSSATPALRRPEGGLGPLDSRDIRGREGRDSLCGSTVGCRSAGFTGPLVGTRGPDGGATPAPAGPAARRAPRPERALATAGPRWALASGLRGKRTHFL